MPYQPVLGQIMPFAGATVPRGWALCNGALLAVTTNQALFSLIGNSYGGNGSTTFALPDLRGRAILGSSGASGTFPAGQTGGSASVTLLTSQIPMHTHLLQASTTQGTGRGLSPTNNVIGVNTIGAPNSDMIFVPSTSAPTLLAPATNITNEGGNGPHNNLQPYLTINYLIAMQGTYPSRN